VSEQVTGAYDAMQERLGVATRAGRAIVHGLSMVSPASDESDPYLMKRAHEELGLPVDGWGVEASYELYGYPSGRTVADERVAAESAEAAESSAGESYG
jgi:hypothetical protein